MKTAKVLESWALTQAVLGCPRLGALGLFSEEQIFVSTLHKNTLEFIVFTLQMLCK